MENLCKAVACVVVVTLMSLSGFADTPYYSEIGQPNWAASLPVPLGSINVANGNLHIEIPISSIKERGSVWTIKMVYDSIFWQAVQTGMGPLQYMAYNYGGWRTVFASRGYGIYDHDTSSAFCPQGGYPNGDVYTYSNFRFTDAQGTVHSFPGQTVKRACTSNTGQQDPGGSPTTPPAYAFDGSGYYAIITNYTDMQVFAPDGSQINGPDSNGNEHYEDSNYYERDTLGRQWQQLPPGYTINTASYDVHTDFGSPYGWQIIQATSPLTLPSSLALPGGVAQYTFGYDSGTAAGNYGELTSITLPSGGQITFGYTTAVLPNTTQQQRLVSSVSYGGGTWNIGYNIPSFSTSQEVIATINGPLRFDDSANSYISDKTIYDTTAESAFWQGTAQFYSGQSSLLKTVTSVWDGTYHVVTTTLNDTGQVSKETYLPQALNGGTSMSMIWDRIIQKQEWDYQGGGTWTPVRTTKLSYLQDTSSIRYETQYHIINRPLEKDVYAGDGTSGSPVSSTTYSYDEYSAAFCNNNIPNLTNITGATGHDDTNYGVGYWARGNATTISQMISAGVWATSHKCYDTLGNITQQVDAAGHHSTYDYSENWADNTCVAASSVTHAYPTTVTNELGYRNTTKYYSCTGLAQNTKDENDIRTGRDGTLYSYDGMNRLLSQTVQDQNHSPIAQTSFSYNDAVPPTVTQSVLATPDPSIVTDTRYDGLGRVYQTEMHDPDGDFFVDSSYDNLGKIQTVSNPHRSTGASSDGTTKYHYDVFGRTTSVIRQDNNTVSTSYTGNCSTVTDELGNPRKSCSDALGRLSTVVEPNPSTGSLTTGSYTTTYTYDVLDDLQTVNQPGDGSQGARNRSFNYDSLGRLVSASNPESGTITYTYDSAADCPASMGNLVKQLDARGVRTCYTYDPLNRLIGKSYSATTPATPSVTYFYDQTSYNGLNILNQIGRRTGMTDTTSGQTAWSYDAMGHVTTKQQNITAGLTPMLKSIVYTYNSAGAVHTLTYPSGKVLNYTYNSSGLPTSMTTAGGTIYQNYVTNAHYGAGDLLTAATHGDGITESNTFNVRLLPSRLFTYSRTQPALIDFGYTYDAAGNVIRMDNNVSSRNPGNNRSLALAYDNLNRLWTAGTVPGASSPWSNTYGYDSWGNLLTKSASGSAAEPNINLTTDPSNRVFGPTGSGYTYDAAGNMTFDSHDNLNFDAENHVHPASGLQYYYDGDGNRVAKSDGSRYWYDDGGHVLSTADSSNTLKRDYIFFNGRRLGWLSLSSGDPHYYLNDHLGSPRVIANGTGSFISWESDYYPFGSKIPISNADSLDVFYLFTGYEFDYETGDYYASARQQSQRVDRFMSPDEPLRDQSAANPQSWNLYSYVLNNPLNRVDPDGTHCVVDGPGKYHDEGTDGESCAEVEANDKNAQPSVTVNDTVPGVPTDDSSSDTAVYSIGGSWLQLFTTGHFAPASSCGSSCYNAWMRFHVVTSLLGGVYGAVSIGETGGNPTGGAFVEGQQVLKTVQTPEGPLQITAKVEINGDTLVLRNLSVAHEEGIQVTTNPGPAALKAAIDEIKAEAKAAGFSNLRYTALNIRGTPSVIDKTVSLK